MLFIKIGYVSAVIGAVLLTILLALISFIEIPWYFSLPIALGLLLIPAYKHLKRNMIRYTLTDSKIEIDYGLIARTYPWRRSRTSRSQPRFRNESSDLAMSSSTMPAKSVARQYFTISTIPAIMPTSFCVSCAAGIRLKALD
jgi:hypothetical protein